MAFQLFFFSIFWELMALDFRCDASYQKSFQKRSQSCRMVSAQRMVPPETFCVANPKCSSDVICRVGFVDPWLPVRVTHIWQNNRISSTWMPRALSCLSQLDRVRNCIWFRLFWLPNHWALSEVWFRFELWTSAWFGKDPVVSFHRRKTLLISLYYYVI